MTKFQERLKKLRQEAGLKQEELAEKIQVSKYSVSLWERGQRVPENKALKKLSDYFGVSIAYLVGNSFKRNEDDQTEETADWLDADDYLEDLFEKILRLSDDSRLMIQEMATKFYTADQATGNLKPEGQATVHITRHDGSGQ